MPGKDNISLSKTKLLLAVIIVLVVVIGGLVFVFLSGPSVSSSDQAQKLGQDVFKDIGDIKTNIKGG